ncbi:alcohol dehydrogenase [Grosmannia clavigera kw1407]|uniref:Alcohol dehydrogenase n=1 Tax=Grosmannia clavigera (strain kw1407 / UAMH 11150) TaxID=655863 RepID=F0XQK0_GROCL|nr:alcohol dehydrogenase [Grosmannia clavigera kw1407]EFX00301.1 alcohol dehydrogenase [Grosmannia clavigera kw1407]
MTAKTMKAVVFDGPHKISVQDRPVPQLQADNDVIVKVQATALCGSELHVFRGLEKATPGFIMGHEFVGTVVEAGSAVKTVQVGDKVVSPFTTSCLECFYCQHGFSSRCEHSVLFGCLRLDGGQAEYVRVPWADGTLLRAPAEVDDRTLVLMADIFPTGFFGARSVFQLLAPNVAPAEAVVVVVGCGPVGLCAVIAALEHKPRHVFAVDSVDSRLALAHQLGAEPLNFATDRDGMVRRVLEVSGGRGADAVIEVVGLSPALRTAYDLIRPFGAISSIGVHNAEAGPVTDVPWSATDGYDKNVRFQQGRCPVRSIFPDALEVLAKNQEKFGFMFDKIMPLTSAVEGYDLFDNMKVQKVVFTP